MSQSGSDKRKRLFEKFNGVCFYCDEAITFENGTRDHFWPRSKRGWNGDPNMVLACVACNSLKADRLPTLAEYHKFLTFRPETTNDSFHEPIIIRTGPTRRERQLAHRAAKKAAKKAHRIAHNNVPKQKPLDLTCVLFAGAWLDGGFVRVDKQNS